MEYKSTVQVAKLLGCKIWRIQRLLWIGAIEPPEKGPGDSFIWTDEDIKRVKKELEKRGILPKKNETKIHCNT